jgi:hypothetical protein
MQSPGEWSALNEEDRNRMTEIYQNNEREVRGKADLAIETVCDPPPLPPLTPPS